MWPSDFTSVFSPQHTNTGVTALIAASGQGRIDALEQLLAAGADPDVKATNGWMARDFAICQDQKAAIEILESYR